MGRSIIHINWRDVFNGEDIPEDPVQFFSQVRLHKDPQGDYDYVLNCNSLPLSNCFVERIFSQMGFIKTKWRNHTSLDMLDALIRIKARFSTRGYCCRNMVVTPKMLERHNREMYGFQGKKRALDEEEESADEKRKTDEDDREFDYFTTSLSSL